MSAERTSPLSDGSTTADLDRMMATMRRLNQNQLMEVKEFINSLIETERALSRIAQWTKRASTAGEPSTASDTTSTCGSGDVDDDLPTAEDVRGIMRHNFPSENIRRDATPADPERIVADVLEGEAKVPWEIEGPLADRIVTALRDAGMLKG